MGKIQRITAAGVLCTTAMLVLPAVVLAAQSAVTNVINVEASSGGQTATNGSSAQGTSSATVDVKTIIDGEVVEDVHKETENGSVRHESRVSQGGATVETDITAAASTGGVDASGRDGEDGKPGEAGAPGAEGRDGADGQDGQDGMSGNSGEDGQAGTDGISGQAGMSGSATSAGAASQSAAAAEGSAAADAQTAPSTSASSSAAVASAPERAEQAPKAQAAWPGEKKETIASVVTRIIHNMFSYVFSIFS